MAVTHYDTHTYAYTHTHIHTPTNTPTYMYTHTNTYPHKHIHTNTYIHTHTHTELVTLSTLATPLSSVVQTETGVTIRNPNARHRPHSHPQSQQHLLRKSL